MEELDVLVVGAGLSGIGAGYYLQAQCPGRTYAIFEGRSQLGGTWDLFRYPGVRSDSDMYTLGFAFRPWKEAKAIADGPAILRYLQDTAKAYKIDRHIRTGHRVLAADWDSRRSQWIVTYRVEGEAQERQVACNFLHMCSGYYNYEQGYRPEFPGEAQFQGRIIHPQHWPQDLDYSGKRVVVIGSGATAVTLVPAMAQSAAHVTMLQRSPTYMVSRPAEDQFANLLRKILPSKLAYDLIRWRNVFLQLYFYNVTRKHPQKTKEALLDRLRPLLPPDFDVATHLTPRYNPWDQRLCLVPDADMFEALSKGTASIVTDEIASFTETGLVLKSGATLEADVVVTATGLDMKLMHGVQLSIDGVPLILSDTFSYKGIMYSGVPNLSSTFGYTNASWTLKADLTAEYICRLMRHMDRHGLRECRPVNDDPNLAPAPWLDFSSGYVQRAMAAWPKQGTTAPWKVYQNYALDLLAFRFGKLEDGVMRFAKGRNPAVDTGAPAPTVTPTGAL